MKNRLLFSLIIFSAFSGKAQLTKLDFNVPLTQSIAFASKESVLTFDTSAFYIYKKNTTGVIKTYNCDTVKWTISYSVPYTFYGNESANFCSFSDKLNGVIVRKLSKELSTNVILKTGDGGYTWNLLTSIPDSIGYVSSIVIKDFNNLILSSSKTYLYKNGVFETLQFDSILNSSEYTSYKDNIYSTASIYPNSTHISINNGLTWEKYMIPIDTTVSNRGYGALILEKQYIVNGKVYLFHKTSPYTIPEISSLTFVTVIDPYTKEVIQYKQKERFEHMFVSRKGDVFLGKHAYWDHKDVYLGDHTTHTHSVFKSNYNLYLLYDFTTPIKTSTIHVNNEQKQNPVFIHSTYGAGWDFIQSPEAEYLFDDPDCDQIDMSNVKENSGNLEIYPVVTAPIEPINYPTAIILNSHKGDTISEQSRYYYMDASAYEKKWPGKIVRTPSNDSVLVLLLSAWDDVSHCVTKTTISKGIIPLAILDEAMNEADSRLFPNPSVDFVELTGIEPKSTIKIVDNLGSLQYEKQYSFQGEKIDISFLVPGVYTLISSLKNSSVKKMTFIKN